MQSAELTRGQLERNLSQAIQAFYYDNLGRRPTQVVCHIFNERIAIVLEESITQTEKILAEAGQEELAEQVRADVDKALQPKLIELIEATIHVSVADLLSDAKLETGRTGMIAILSDTPQVREPAEKLRQRKQATVSSVSEA